ncbi:hypothetical protein D3C85_1429560 [compost metagenome]
MVLHIYVAGDVNQHGIVLAILASKLSHRTSQHESAYCFIQGRWNDLLPLVGWDVGLIVLGWHPS